MLDPTGQFTLGGMSIGISASRILSTSIKAYGLYKSGKDWYDKVDKLLNAIPGMKLNNSMTREQFLGKNLLNDLEYKRTFGMITGAELKLNLGAGAVGTAYEIATDMAGDAGKHIAYTYSYPVAYWLADLPVAGQYISCDFNDWVSHNYAKQLILQLAASVEPRFKVAQKIIGLHLMGFNYYALMGTTAIDTYSIQPPQNSCVSPFLR